MSYSDEEDENYGRNPPEKIPSPKFRVWRPSANYRYELRDISEQFTPAESYKHVLQTLGKEQRDLQRLEWKWMKNFELWSSIATKIKALYRGMLGRRYFNKVKLDLQLKLAQRRCKEQSIEAYYIQNNSQLALNIISTVPLMNRELYLIKFKIMYTYEKYNETIDDILKYLSIKLYYILLYYILYKIFLNIDI